MRRRCSPVRPSSVLKCSARTSRSLRWRRIRSLSTIRSRSLVRNRSPSTIRSRSLIRSRNPSTIRSRNLVRNRNPSIIHSRNLIRSRRRPRIPLPPLPRATTIVNTSSNRSRPA